MAVLIILRVKIRQDPVKNGFVVDFQIKLEKANKNGKVIVVGLYVVSKKELKDF